MARGRNLQVISTYMVFEAMELNEISAKKCRSLEERHHLNKLSTERNSGYSSKWIKGLKEMMI